MRRSAVILVAATALAAVALVVPPAAASESTAFTLPAGAPHPDATDGNCRQLRQSAGKPAAGGKTTATCIRRKATTSPLRAATRTGTGATNTKLATAPDFCNGGPNEWVYSRTQVCRLSTFWLDAYDIVTGRYRGTATVDEVIYAYTSADANIWYTQVNLTVKDIFAITPLPFAGTVIWATFDCSGDCWVGQANFPPQFIVFGGSISGEASFSANTVLPQLPVYGVSGISYHTSPRLPQVPDPDPVWMGVNVRCDIKTSTDDELSSSGCIVPMWRPTLYLRESKYRQVVHHVQAAINSGLRSTLHRLADRNAARRNGDAACPTAWERPFGHSCDEYPFRSTYEGARFERDAGYSGRTFNLAPEPCNIAALPTGVTGSRGWSSCWVRIDQNSYAGADVGTLYRKDRVIDGEAFDVAFAL